MKKWFCIFLVCMVALAPVVSNAAAWAVAPALAKLAVTAAASVTATTAATLLTITLASGLIGYYLLPPDSAARLYAWAVGQIGSAFAYLTGVGSKTYADQSGHSVTISIQDVPPSGNTPGAILLKKNGTTAMSFPYHNGVAGYPTRDAALAGATAPSYQDSLFAGTGLVMNQVKSADDGTLNWGNLSPSQIANAPAVPAYITPGIADAITAGANYTVSGTSSIAAQDAAVVADQVGAEPTDGTEDSSRTIEFDKSGLATDINQRQQIQQMDCVVTGINALPGRLSESMRMSDHAPTISERWAEVTAIARTRFPFSMVDFIPAGWEPPAPTGGFRLGSFELIGGNPSTKVDIDFGADGNVMGDVLWYCHAMIRGFIALGTAFYLYRRVNTI